MSNRVDAFLAYVRDRQGPAPAGADSWGALAERLATVPPEVLEDRFARVESVFEVDTARDDYESWSAAKRMAANADAVSALYEAEAAGGAGPELRRRMFAYTGMGGMGGDIGVLPDVFPREYVAASRALQDQKYGKVTGSTELMERLLDQFFTPIDVCNALWALVQRTNPHASSAIEPSAGIGRMLRTAPSTYQWLANEIDPLMGRMLRMCFPEAEVTTGPFEKVRKRARADLVVGNPPYGKRPPEMLRLDRPDEGDMVHYFIDRAVAALNPGGTLAYVVPYAFLINQGGRQFRERLLSRTVFRGAAILPSGTFPSVKAGTFALILFTRRYQDIQPAAFDEREQTVAAGGYPMLPEAPQSVCGGVWADSPWRDGRQYLKGEPDLSRIHSLFLSPGPAAPEVRTTSKGKTGAAGAGPSGTDRPVLGWKRRKSAPVDFTRETESIRGAIVESGLLDVGFRASLVLAGFPGPKGRPEVVPIDGNTVQISIPTWFGAFVASQIERIGDRYEVLAASGVSTASGKMTPRVGSRWSAPTLGEVPTWAFRDLAKAWRPAPADLNRLAGRGPIAQLVLDYLSRHLGAVEALNVGGGFIARPSAGDPLFVQWARGGPGAAYLSVSSLSAKDTSQVLTSAVLVFPDDTRAQVSDPLYVVQGGQPTDPQAHKDVDASWSRTLRANGVFGAAPGVFTPDPDAAVLRGSGVSDGAPTPSDEPAEPDADTTALVDELREFVRAMANDPAQAEAQRQAIRTRLLTYLGTHGNPHPGGPPILRALTRPDGTLEPVLDQPIVSGLDSEPPSDGTFAEIVEWWSSHRGFALPTDFTAEPEEVLGAALAGEDTCVEIEGETTRIYAKWAYFQGSPVIRLRAIDDLLGAGVPLDPRLVEKLTWQKDQVLTRWKNQRTLGEMDVTPRSPFVPLACIQDWINSELWGGFVPTEVPPIKLLVNDGIMTVDPADEGLAQFASSSRSDERKWALLHWLLGYWSRETLVADMQAGDGGGKRTHGGASAEEKIRIDADNVEKFLVWLGTSPWADTVEAEYNNLFAPALADEYPTGPVEIPGQSREIRLHPHQNQVVRRLTMGGRPGSLLFAGDVGSGKTFAGIATAVRWKATGVCRRPLVVVPVSVMAKWESDAQWMFPNLRIGVIGITRGESRGGKVTYRSDEPGERLEKWYRFAAGAYDLTIVGHQAFFRDLEPNEADVLSMLHTVAWTRKQAGAKVADLNRANEREAALTAERERVERVVDYDSFRTLFPKAREKSADEFRKKNLARIDKELAKIAEARESIGALGTDKEVSQVSIAIREMMEGKKYRPQIRVLADGSTVVDDDEEAQGDSGEDKPEKAEAQVVKEPLPGLLMFSDIGVDGLVLDEAHKLKNLWFPQNKIEYAGGGQDKPFGVKAPWDMFFKTWMIRRKHGGSGGILFLTATPMTNSPLELYSMLSMVSPKVFEDAKIYDKEQFIDRYWQVESKMVVKPGGTVERAPALIGFKNLDELRGLIAPAFDRKSNAYLFQAGWVKEQPASETQPIDLPRDPAQTAIVRTLVAIRAAWLDKTSSSSDEGEEGASAGQNVLAGIAGIKMRWGVRADGELYERGEISEKAKPKEMSEDKKARAVFRLVWMSMLDKAATDPRLILTYAAEVPERLGEYQTMEERYQQYVADKAAGKKVKKTAPRRPSPSDYMTVDLASALLNQLDLAGVAAYYSAHPVVNKVAMLAKIIAANANDPKRCAHVVFSDDKQIHEDIRRAVVDATKRMGANAVTADRIAAITGDTAKQRRLTLSQEFNGLDGLGQEITPKYDVMIGTTKAMGEGIDLQRRSCAVHHINLPWTPADLIQRNGRAVRQGNRRGFVSLFYYQTQRTFDGVRYDKVARKAAWWDQMFDGNSATNNPATSSDESDLDETILRMVIEDEEELETRLAELRAAKAERYRAEVYGKIRKAWNTLNATFKDARNTIDPITREHRFRGAMSRRDSFLTKFPEFAPVLSQAIQRLNDEPVMLSFPDLSSEGSEVKPPMPLTAGMVVLDRKILSIAVHPAGMRATIRARGAPTAEDALAHKFENLSPDELGVPWTFRDEVDSLVANMAIVRFAELSPDLWPHAMSLWRGWLAMIRANARGRGPSIVVPRTTPLLLGPTPAGESVAPVFLIDTGDLSADSYLMGQQFSQKMDEVQNVLATDHPESWGLWIRAFRADRLYATNYEKGYPKVAVGLSIARKTPEQWESYVSARFRKKIPAADMAQRLKLTHESK